MESSPRHYCLFCGWNCRLEVFPTRLGHWNRWVCHGCGASGIEGSADMPKPANPEDQKESDWEFSRKLFPK